MEYKLNKHNVFVNPEVLEIDKDLIINLASRNNKWYYGYIYDFSTLFASSPCMELDFESFNTRIDALKSAINYLIKSIERQLEVYQNYKEYATVSKRMRKSICNLKAYLYEITHIQLSLFDEIYL